jgi:hypothetical protein
MECCFKAILAMQGEVTLRAFYFRLHWAGIRRKFAK